MALKCYTRKKNNGGNYTNCVDDKGKQMREKDKKKVVKKQPVKRKKLLIVNNVNKPKLLPVDKKPVISVASGAPGTKTPFNATKPVKSEAMREADEALDDVEEALMRNVLGSAAYPDEGSAEQQANEAIAMMKLATTPKPKKKLAPAGMRTVKVGKSADDKIKKMLGNVSETNSALSSSAPTKRDVMRERMKRRIAASEQKKQAAPGYKEKQAARKKEIDDYNRGKGYFEKGGGYVGPRKNKLPDGNSRGPGSDRFVAMSDYDQDELMAELMS